MCVYDNTINVSLAKCSFQETILDSGTTLYRFSQDGYPFQRNQDEINFIAQGRFNRQGQYGWYLANSPDACIIDRLLDDASINDGTLYTMQIEKEFRLLDLNRWRYICPPYETGDAHEFSVERRIINQHVSCPRLCRFNWLYGSTNIIADYARKRNYDGICYISAPIHLLNGSLNTNTLNNFNDRLQDTPEMINEIISNPEAIMNECSIIPPEMNPEDIINYCLFTFTEKVKLVTTYTKHSIDNVRNEYNYIDGLLNNYMNDEHISGKIFANNGDQEQNQSQAEDIYKELINLSF